MVPLFHITIFNFVILLMAIMTTLLLSISRQLTFSRVLTFPLNMSEFLTTKTLYFPFNSLYVFALHIAILELSHTSTRHNFIFTSSLIISFIFEFRGLTFVCTHSQLFKRNSASMARAIACSRVVNPFTEICTKISRKKLPIAVSLKVSHRTKPLSPGVLSNTELINLFKI